MLLLRKWQPKSLGALSNLSETVGCVSAAFLLLVVLLQYPFVGRHDPYRCTALLDDGAWPTRDTLSESRKEFGKWEPTGCRMHEYTRDTFHDCLADRRVVFVGDSATRQLFFASAKRLDYEKADEKLLDVFVNENVQRDVSLEAYGVALEFKWDPWLNSSALTELRKFRPLTSPAITATGQIKSDASAALLVLGAPGFWAARHGGEDYLGLFQQRLDLIRPYIQDYLQPQTSNGLTYETLQNRILLDSVHVPWYAKLSPGRALTLSPDRIQRMNDYLDALPTPERSHLITVYRQMTDSVEHRAFEDNGLHVNEAMAERWIDIALNVRCNSGIAKQGYANKTTCCVSYSAPVRGQIIVFGIFASGTLFLRAMQRRRLRITRHLPSEQALKALRIMGSMLGYCYLADRTHLFVKEERHYSQTSLIILIVVFTMVSLLSIDKNTSQVQQPGVAKGRLSVVDDAGFLSREITNEWKGLMQVMFLLFSFQGTSETLWVYKLIRLLGACYVFLSTYGHTMYFLRTQDFSFRRVAAILLRLNTMSYLAGLMMKTNYILPIAYSFWFLVAYMTLKIFPQYNADPIRLFGKIVGSAFLVIWLLQMTPAMDIAATVLKIFGTDLFPTEHVKNEISLERFIAYFGMLAAALVHRVDIVKKTYRERLRRRIQYSNPVDKILAQAIFPDHFTAPLQPITITFALLFFSLFLVITHVNFDSKESYNVFHPYLSCMAVISYAVLRNCHRALRNAYLWLPSTLGQFALATYILHNHLWLSGDGTGLLRTGVWRRNGGWVSTTGGTAETVLFTITLLWASVKAHQATQSIAAWIMGGSVRADAPDDIGNDPEKASVSDNTEGSGGLLGQDKISLSDGHLDKRLRSAWFTDARIRMGSLVLGMWIMNLIYD